MIAIPRFIGSLNSAEQADIILFGIPYDATSSFRSSSRTAMKMMRIISEDAIEDFSFAQGKGLDTVHFYDAGDMDLMVGNPALMIDRVETELKEELFRGKLPVAVGGEHLVTLPLIRHALNTAPDLILLQLDAHADLRRSYAGQELSHASIMRLSLDAGVQSLIQLGVRSGDQHEYEMRQNDSRIIPAQTVDEAINAIPNSSPLYLTVDIDFFDPSCVPGTGTPEAGGAHFDDFILLMKKLRQKHIKWVGADITELAPELDQSGRSTVFGAKLLRELLVGIGG